MYIVYLLKFFRFENLFPDGFHSFRDAFPEWCEENSSNQDMESSPGTTQADQLMGLR